MVQQSSPKVSTGVISTLSGATAQAEDGAHTGHSPERNVPPRSVDYRRYSRFISSDDDFFILRRFSVLNVRVALALQHQIVMLEQQLEELDDKYGEGYRGDPAVHNGQFEGEEKDRENLIFSIGEKLRKYNELILQQSAIRGYKPAPQQDIKNIFRWHVNFPRAICKNELQYLHYGRVHGYLNDYHDAFGETEVTRKTRTDDDLICVVQKEKPPLRRVIDSSRLVRTLDLWKVKQGPMPENGMEDVTYFSERRLDIFVSLTTTMIGLAMLVTPIWILQSTESLQIKLIVITVFIIVFLLVLSFGMVAKPFEALGATAGYAAVLMVFMQLGITQ